MNFHIRFIIFIFILLWTLGIFIELLIPYFNWLALLYPSLKLSYATVCHQQIEKIASVNGHNLLVCSRCTGIYLGSLFSSVMLLFIRMIKIDHIKYLLISIIPMIMDVILYSLRIYTYSKEIAFFTGIFFGIVGIAYIYNGIQILFLKEGRAKT